MKSIALLGACFAFAAQAAVSTLLFPFTEPAPIHGAVGNITFNGTCFVAVIARTNDCQITFLHTNGGVISNLFLPVTPQAPRIAASEASLLLAWTDTNNAGSPLRCSLVGNGGALTPSDLATSIAPDSVVLRPLHGRFLALWQTTGSASTVQARWIAADGVPDGDAFAVSPSTASQVYPSVNSEGDNCLVAWMEQSMGTNDWRVLARFVDDTGPIGSTITVSQTNSLRPYRTACAYETNFLVVWSRDEGPWTVAVDDPSYHLTNVWYPMVFGRTVNDNVPRGSEFPVIRAMGINIGVGAAFGENRFLVGCANYNRAEDYYGRAIFRPILSDGSLTETAFIAAHPGGGLLIYGATRWCSTTTDSFTDTWFTFVGHQTMPDPRLVNLRRGPSGIGSVESTRGLGNWEAVQLSTNLIDWSYRPGSVLGDVASLGGERQLFVRLYEPKWNCIENLRAIKWAKLQWALDHQRSGADYPNDARLTFWVFLAQVLSPGSSCRSAVRQGQAHARLENRRVPDDDTSAYCQARLRWCVDQLHSFIRRLANRLEARVPSSAQWCGRVVKIVDATTFTALDTPANQSRFPQTSRQKRGCGFPTIRLLGLFGLASGALLGFATGDYHQSEMALLAQIWNLLNPRDVLLGDRYFGCYRVLALVVQRQADAVCRLNSMRKADLRCGKRRGPLDRQIVWERPTKVPPGMTQAQWLAMPATLTVRLVRFRVEEKGFRTREVTLVTTLLDAQQYPVTALAALYRRRWQVELSFRQIKIVLAMDHLAVRSPEMIERSLAMHLIAYQLLRGLMQEASLLWDVPLDRISFQGALDAAHHFADAMIRARSRKKQTALSAELLRVLAADAVPERPGRHEPRAIKRRPKAFPRLTCPRRKFRDIPHRSRVITARAKARKNSTP